MKHRYIITLFAALLSLPITAQMLNFSLRTNNQQLIDEALSGAFVKINQSYELCDTIKDEHFGRNEKDYFSIIPFIGIETDKGLLFPTAIASPWLFDEDFNEYKAQYKPIVTQSTLSLLNQKNENNSSRTIQGVLSGRKVSQHFSIFCDSTVNNSGLKVDTIAGAKKGWLIWFSSGKNLSETDSIRFFSVTKDLEVPSNGACLTIDKPDISDTLYGGVYVTTEQSGIGQITFTLTGVLVLTNEGWVIDFPFVESHVEKKSLTPIHDIITDRGLNQLKKKRK